MIFAMRLPISRRSALRSLGAAPIASLPAQADVARTDNGYAALRRVRLWESTRKEFREALDGGALKVVIVPTGSTEQHNEHLAMITDTASVTLVAELAALRLYPQAMVATPVSVGISPYWMDRKGTLTLRRETFLAVVFDICESLKIHGVKNLLILNGHGGNEKPLEESVAAFREKLGVNLRYHNYWDAYTPAIIRRNMQSNKAPAHAAEFETSFALAAFPERVRWEGVDYAQAKPHLRIKEPESAQQDEEFFHEAKLATAAKGEAMIAIAVDWVAGQLRRMTAEA